MSTTGTADGPVLVLMLDSDSERIRSMAAVISKGIASKILTCNTPLGCLALARTHKPRIVFIHSSEAVVENVSMVEMIRALCPDCEVRVLD